MDTLAKTKKKFKTLLGDNSDIVCRDIVIGNKEAFIVFIDLLVDENIVNDNIISEIHKQVKECKDITFESIKTSLNAINSVESAKDINAAVDNCFKGYVALVVQDMSEILCMKASKVESRAIIEPPTSAVMHGPREGFTEDIKTNMILIRKRLLTGSLKIVDKTAGVRTKTSIKVLYLKDVADNGVVNKIIKKIDKINIDGIIDSTYVAQYLAERPYSIFKQIGLTEKPDVVVSKILEGRVAIIVDGSPVVLTLPYLLLEDLQSNNDYYIENHRVSFLRVLRMFGIIISSVVPGFYVAMQLYHYKVFPLKFLISIINTTQNVPLNPFAEILFILLLFEVLYEASLRMPKYVGMALSIVGALILGDTAVQAGLISPPGVMIVAISSITVYTTPDISSQIFLIRFLLVLLGGFMGFIGIMLGGAYIMVYLLDFDNYGAPYFAPFTPYVANDRKDFVLKRVLMEMDSRPKSFKVKDRKRQK